MDNPVFSFIIIPIFLLIIYSIVINVRSKLAKLHYKKEVQTPGGFDTLIANLLTLLTFFSAVLTFFGIIIQETEMMIVFLVLTVIFTLIVMTLKRAHDTSYQENTEYFILRVQKKEYQVFYKNIVNWQPHLNEIRILDETSLDNEYIRVNISIFTPEILLRKIAEMTFEEKFYSLDDTYFEDPTREYQIINFFTKNNYGYLIEDYIEEYTK